MVIYEKGKVCYILPLFCYISELSAECRDIVGELSAECRDIVGELPAKCRDIVGEFSLPKNFFRLRPMSLLVMAEIGRDCAVSVFCCLCMGRYMVGCEWL